MNAQSKTKAAQTVEDVLDELDATRAARMKIWNALCRTDPAHTKQFQRAGGFRGTALKPIWVEKRLTELFGPCGTGWGTEKPNFRVVEAGVEMLVFCTVRGWYIDPDKEPNENMLDRRYVYGVGGDKIVVMTKNGPKVDDEAFKKAATDAIGNAFKHVGVGADIHMGQFDDSKYVAEVAAEFTAPPPNRRQALDGPYTSPTQLKTAAREFVRTLESMGDLAEFAAWAETDDYKAFCTQLERDMPDWWAGGPSVPAEFVPLEIRIDQKRRDLEQLEGINAKGRP